VEEVDKALERLSLSNLCPKNRGAKSLFDFGMEIDEPEEIESIDDEDEYEYEDEYLDEG
jgi:hypothetical protein